MKTVEEKAKAYDEVINKLQNLINNANKQGHIIVRVEDIENSFPELKELEDEKVRKVLIDLVKCNERSGYKLLNNIPTSSMLAWLEKQGVQKAKIADFKAKDWYVSKVDGKIYNAKFMEKTPTNQARKLEIEKAAMSATGIIEQEEWFIKGAEWSDKNPSYISSEKQGEQKPTDKVEPKFKVGDYVVGKYISGYISEVRDDCYLLDYQGFSIDKQDNYHLWTIDDAKDGDVLCTPNGNTFIFKTIDGDKILDYCGLYFNKFFSDFGSPNGSSTHYDKCNYHPATKEQCDLLFQKMKESGYEWDAEKKELRKIDARKNLTLDGDLMQADCMIVEQKHTQEIEPFEAEHGKYYYCIKDYFCGGRKQASKGDVVQALRGLPIMGLKDASEYFLPVNFIKCNSAWSEEDEEMCQETIDWFEKKCFPYALENDNPARESIKWLKSLKNKVQPQNTWKPSDEQMEALFVLLPTVCNSNPAFSLYNDLKKLKGE